MKEENQKALSVEGVVEEFEEDFREYLDASIRYAETSKPYRPLSSEDEIKWLKNWLRKTIIDRDREVEERIKRELSRILKQWNINQYLNKAEVERLLHALNKEADE